LQGKQRQGLGSGDLRRSLVDSPAIPEQERLSRSTPRGALWNSLAYGLSKVALLPTTLILARLVSAKDFGLLALALVAVTYLDVLRQFGIATALVQWPDDDDLMAGVAFWLSALSGVITAAGAVLLAPLVAAFFRQPDLTPMLRVLALALVIDSVAGVYEARLRKRLQFQRRVGPELARALVKGVVSIALAILGVGVWSLIVGQLAGSVVGAVLYCSVSGWVPALQFDRSIAHALLRSGSQFMLFALFAIIIKDVDYLIIGKRISADAVGYYTLAFRLPEFVILGICYVFSQTVFPVFSRLQHDPRRLARAFLKTVHFLLLVTLPLGAGMALVTPELVHVAFSERWLLAIPSMRWLSLYASVVAIGFVVGDVYKATGRTATLNALALLKLGITVPVLWVASAYGIEKVALSQLVVISVIVSLELFVALRILAIPVSRLLSAFAVPCVAVLVMTGSVVASRWLVKGGSPVVRLTTFTLVGASTYAGCVLGLARNAVMEVVGAGLPGLSRSKNPASE
jgi:lipopolysaccharide exporter